MWLLFSKSLVTDFYTCYIRVFFRNRSVIIWNVMILEYTLRPYHRLVSWLKIRNRIVCNDSVIFSKSSYPWLRPLWLSNSRAQCRCSQGSVVRERENYLCSVFRLNDTLVFPAFPYFDRPKERQVLRIGYWGLSRRSWLPYRVSIGPNYTKNFMLYHSPVEYRALIMIGVGYRLVE